MFTSINSVDLIEFITVLLLALNKVEKAVKIVLALSSIKTSPVMPAVFIDFLIIASILSLGGKFSLEYTTLSPSPSILVSQSLSENSRKILSKTSSIVFVLSFISYSIFLTLPVNRFSYSVSFVEDKIWLLSLFHPPMLLCSLALSLQYLLLSLPYHKLNFSL